MKVLKAKIKKGCFIGLFGLMVCGGTVPVNAEVSVSECTTESVQPLADDIGWVYKEVGDKVYRRLYNFTTQEYIGDWILCG